MERKKKASRGGHGFWGAICLGLILSVACGMALILLFAAIALRCANPTALVLPFGLAALAVCSLLCGILCAKLWGHGSVIPSLIGGCILAVVVGAAGLCIPGSTLSAWMRLAGCPAVALLAALGGLLTCHRGQRRRRRH